MLYNMNMDMILDVHTHSVASGHHTKDTATDLAKRAAELGLKYLGIADHAPKMIGTTSVNYFRNLHFCPKNRFGVNLLYGAELNILNDRGEVDLPSDVLAGLDFTIASLHKDVFSPSTEEVNTKALINAMKNKYVNVIGHPDDPTFAVNCHSLTDAAKEYGVMLELNSVSTDLNGYRKTNLKWLIEMLVLCKQKGVHIILGSDSHGREKIADFGNSIKVLQAIDFPRELVVNYDDAKFFDILKR